MRQALIWLKTDMLVRSRGLPDPNLPPDDPEADKPVDYWYMDYEQVRWSARK